LIDKLKHFILYLDYNCWYFLNTQWHNSFFDLIIPFFRNQWFWAPLYLFLLIFMPLNFGKKGWFWCLAFLISFGLSDSISADVIKPFFHRARPCNTLSLSSVIHLIVPCGSGYSFPSSHAANHFCLAFFAAVSLKPLFKWIWWVALPWAILVSYAQVYVGVHFPLDVTCGALLGIAIGTCTGFLFKRYFKLQPQFQNQEDVPLPGKSFT
jgi:undecaprenyl-diphosphatase